MATIASPETILRWYRELVAKKYDGSRQRKQCRPKTSAEIATIVVKLARENTWGYTRIKGALKNLGHEVGRNTIKRILQEDDIAHPLHPRSGIMVKIMKNQGEHQHVQRFLKSAMLLAGFLGLACSSSGLTTGSGDAATLSGGQAGSPISNGSTDGAGGSLGPVGAGGGSTGGTTGSGRSSGGGGTAGNARTSSSSTGGQGGLSSSTPCLADAWCNVGKIVDDEQGNADMSKECPAERDCYAIYNRCTSTLCVLPEGVHCTDKITCNPGDTEASLDGYCSQFPCYNVQLCTNIIWCKYSPDAGVNASSPDTGADAYPLDAGHCGDGIIQIDLGEKCDFGTQNGVFQSGLGTCTLSCQWIPYLP